MSKGMQEYPYSPPVEYEIVADPGVISVDNPPVTALFHADRDGFQKSIRTARTEARWAMCGPLKSAS